MATVGEKVTDTIVNAIGKGVQGFTLAQHEDMKAVIGPRVESYLAALPADSPVRAELEHMTTSSTFNDAIITALGMVISMISSLLALGDPITEAVRRTSWSTNPTKRLDMDTAIRAERWGLITEDQRNQMLREQGYFDSNWSAILAAHRPVMGADDIRDAFLRHIISPDFRDRMLKRLGYDAGDLNTLQLLWTHIASFQDLLRFAHHGLLGAGRAGQALEADTPPKALVDGAGQLGIDADLATRMWQSHFEHPAGSQALEMWHRGIITEAQLNELLTLQGMDPDWQDQVKASSHPPLPRLVIRQLLHLGLMTEQQAFDAHKALGFDDAASRQMVDYCKAFYGLENADPTADDRELTKAEVLDGYHKGVITADQARTALQGLNYADTTVDFYLAREDLKNTQQLKEAYLTRFQALYVGGILSADEVTSDLTTLGLAEAEIKQQLSLWYLQRISQVQRPTKAELIRWYKAGIISEEIWTAEMKLEGFTDRYISWYNAEIKAAPALAQQTEEAA